MPGPRLSFGQTDRDPSAGADQARGDREEAEADVQGQVPRAGRAGLADAVLRALGRRRWQSSSFANWPPAVFVTKQTRQLPSAAPP
ncbi:hypothetical protein [Embleya sp. NBC_00896]|uniref:hypothetical protein n=1 Tax=Embleya sp. NBC_00896 TaxID=2975961 RepID=UPI00386F1801|nr:hypothetical protein OG928_14365 [Embleya sp. NBC_00896]